MSNQKVVIATSNTGKINELQDLCASWPCMLIEPPRTLDIAETGSTFIENACIKARAYAKDTGLPAIADDSGLVIDALNGEPGLYSARYAGEDATASENMRKVLEMLANKPKPWTARFVCLLVLMRHANDPDPIITHGSWTGVIVDEPRGHMNHGYDPIFQPRHHDCTAAEILLEVKNRYSHRAQAIHKMTQYIARTEFMEKI